MAIAFNFSETINTRKEWSDILKGKKSHQLKIFHPVKLSFKSEGEEGLPSVLVHLL
jgi:hypothetical protein